jgi:hypothetical protein
MRVAPWVRAETLRIRADGPSFFEPFFRSQRVKVSSPDLGRRGKKPQEGRRNSRELHATSPAQKTPKDAPGGDGGRKAGEDNGTKSMGGGKPKGAPAQERGEP